MSECCSVQAQNQRERKLLWLVLSLNATMFFVEFIAGWIADSSSLMADSLDMLADTAVYSLSLLAVGRSPHHKARAAMLNGSLQLALGVLVLVDIGRRVWLGSEPQAHIMTSIASLALAVNVICFGVLYQFRRGDINLRASWICSRNDMLANVGVLAAAALVTRLDSPWPDWAIAAVIAVIVIHSALLIIRGARIALRGDIHAGQASTTCSSLHTPS